MRSDITITRCDDRQWLKMAIIGSHFNDNAMNDGKIPIWAARSGWWERLQPGEQARVASEVSYLTVRVGEPLQRYGESALHWVGLVSGLAKFTVTSVSGKQIVYSGIGAGGWFGEGTLMRKGVWRYEVHAVRDCELALIPRDTFLWLLARNLPFNQYLLRQLNDRLELMTLQALDDHQGGAESIVARALRHLFHPLAGADGSALRVTQSEIGQLCDLSRQRVNQAFQRLEADGVLLLRYGGVEVIDEDKLRDWEFRNMNSRAGPKLVHRANDPVANQTTAASRLPHTCAPIESAVGEDQREFS
ncbi:MAG: Crp/Fnr family transcriptional regulator [Thiomonas sp.]